MKLTDTKVFNIILYCVLSIIGFYLFFFELGNFLAEAKNTFVYYLSFFSRGLGIFCVFFFGRRAYHWLMLTKDKK